MKCTNKKALYIFFLGVCILGTAVIHLLTQRYTEIDQWSSSLSTEKIEWAQVSKDYGIEEYSYQIPKEEYGELVSKLKTVTEKVSSQKKKTSSLKEGYRLILYYEQKLWLFKCCQDEVVSLMFEDAQTGKTFGCEGTLLYIKSPELWYYIVENVDKKAVQQ